MTFLSPRPLCSALACVAACLAAGCLARVDPGSGPSGPVGAGAETRCVDDLDDDGDGLVDCDDPDCSWDPRCGGPDPEAAEVCEGGEDEDRDGLVDCADPDCGEEAACAETVAERCADSFDNDGDGLVDCADPDCDGHPACLDAEPEDCEDRVDDDHDLFIDCADPDCEALPICNTGLPEICDDGLDNDGDGAVDCGDGDCHLTEACPTCPPREVCTDGVDNNWDGFVDCADDWCRDEPLCLHDPECDVFTQDCTGPDDSHLMCILMHATGSECVSEGSGRANDLCRRPTDCGQGLQCSSVAGTSSVDPDAYYMTVNWTYVEMSGGRCRPFCRAGDPASCPEGSVCGEIGDAEGYPRDEGVCVRRDSAFP